MNTDAPRRGASGPAEEYARARAVAAGTPRAGVAEGRQGVQASWGCADAPDAPGAVQPALGPVPAMCDAVDAACLAWLRAPDANRGEGALDLDDLPAGGVSDEFRRGAAFAELCHRRAEADRAEALRLRGPDPLDALDRLAEAVDALAAERDELRERIARAVAALDEAPDIDPDKASKRAVLEVLRANTLAWSALVGWRDPPSRRRAEDAPRDAGDAA